MHKVSDGTSAPRWGAIQVPISERRSRLGTSSEV